MKQKENMPMLVYWGLYGINSRLSAQSFMWTCIALAVGSVAYGFIDHLGFPGIIFLMAAGWYWYAINWVDKHSSWDKT